MNQDARRSGVLQCAEDLDELYQLVQGAPYANTILDAKSSLFHQDLDRVLELIESAQDLYRQANRRILRRELGDIDELPQAEQLTARRFKQRQDRCHSVLSAFDDVTDTLRRMIRLRGGKSPSGQQEADPLEPTVEQLLRPSSAFRHEYAAARTPQQQAQAILNHFLVQAVDSARDLATGALYYFHGKENTHLVLLHSGEPSQEALPLKFALSNQQLKPIPRSRFLESGRRRKLVRLLPKPPGATQPADVINMLLAPAAEERPSTLPRGAVVLDMGDFSQLYDAAVRSGLVPNADSIAHVRDREFRIGEYQQAYQVLEGLFGKFSAAASHRDQRLRREDVDIASGRVKMSPKALLEKRSRDRAESQRIDRARGRFLRVMEGLRVMMRHGAPS